MEIVKSELNGGIESLLNNRTTFIERVLPILKPNQDFYEIMNKKSLAKGGAEKLATIFNLTAEFQVDKETMELLKQDGLVAYVCNLKQGEMFRGQGRGSDTLARNKADANKTIKMAQKRAFVDAVIRTTGLSDIFTQDMGPDDAPELYKPTAKTYPLKRDYPVKKAEPIDPRKSEIKKLCDEIDPLLKTADDYARFVKEKTDLELVESNFDKIISALNPAEEIKGKPWETDPRFAKEGKENV